MDSDRRTRKPQTSRTELLTSLKAQEARHRVSLILNPVENLPFAPDLAPAAGFLHGLYNSDKVRTPEQQLQTVHQFAGRGTLAQDCTKIYAEFAHALGASDATLRLLSGLHAHIIVFMAIAKPGQSVLLLPEVAGGHVSTKAILERLGLNVIEMVTDVRRHCVDIGETILLSRRTKPEFLFVDRSEGLVYEDFRELVRGVNATSIFDASQYLTNIIAGDHPSPFDVGFDLVLSSLHKNFPGPQKALVATKVRDDRWSLLLSGISKYVSSMHVHGTYTAGLTLLRDDELRLYSKRMLDLAVTLDRALLDAGIDVVSRPDGPPPTHHVWVRAPNRTRAFEMFKSLETCGLLVNYRLLPYDLGFGLRLGLCAAARLGMTVEQTESLAGIIADILERGAGPAQGRQAQAFISSIWAEFDASP